jgi:hypothetical protein
MAKIETEKNCLVIKTGEAVIGRLYLTCLTITWNLHIPPLEEEREIMESLRHLLEGDAKAESKEQVA